jgi:hypothetical protein
MNDCWTNDIALFTSVGTLTRYFLDRGDEKFDENTAIADDEVLN